MSTRFVYNCKTKSLIADILKDYDPEFFSSQCIANDLFYRKTTIVEIQ